MSDFDKLEFSPFDLRNILLGNDNDPDENLFKIHWLSNTSYFTIKVKSELSSGDCSCFSILHLNIRGFRKNWDKLINFLATLLFQFRPISILETWFSEQNGNSGP